MARTLLARGHLHWAILLLVLVAAKLDLQPKTDYWCGDMNEHYAVAIAAWAPELGSAAAGGSARAAAASLDFLLRICLAIHSRSKLTTASAAVPAQQHASSKRVFHMHEYCSLRMHLSYRAHHLVVQ